MASSGPMRPTQARLLGASLLVVCFSAITILVVIWPSQTDSSTTDPSSLGDETRLFIISMLAGLIGGLGHSLSRFASSIARGRLRRRWLTWFIMRAPIGMLFGLLAYFLMKGGLLPTTADAVNPYGVAAIAAIAGLTAETIVRRLGDSITTLSTSSRSGES